MLHQSKNYLSLVLILLALTLGCGPAAEPEGNGETDPHLHEAGDDLVWEVKQKIVDSEFEIWLGHHGNHFHADDPIEPAISITKSGEAYADAKVFNVMVDPNDPEKTLGEEIATVYEPATEDEIAHYAQGELKIPSGATKFVIRYRIVIADRADHIVDVPGAVDH
ncbi:MAG: hypothetical protein ACI9G1_002598 [Pirellulaceae bacterium]|jgi:hypothetical protein